MDNTDRKNIQFAYSLNLTHYKLIPFLQKHFPLDTIIVPNIKVLRHNSSFFVSYYINVTGQGSFSYSIPDNKLTTHSTYFTYIPEVSSPYTDFQSNVALIFSSFDHNIELSPSQILSILSIHSYLHSAPYSKKLSSSCPPPFLFFSSNNSPFLIKQ